MTSSTINQKGSILAAVIILGLILAVGGLTVLMVSTGTSHHTEEYHEEGKVLAAAESGLRLALGSILAADAPILPSDYQILPTPATNGFGIHITVTNAGVVTATTNAPVLAGNLYPRNTVKVKATFNVMLPGILVLSDYAE